jgi:hypothetical protein
MAAIITIGETTAQTVERTVRRVVFVLASTSLCVEPTPRELLQVHANVLPQMFGRLAIPICKLVNPARD